MNEPDATHETPLSTAIGSLQGPDTAAPAGAEQPDGWDAYYERLKRQQKLTKAIEADNAIHAYLTGAECRFDDETFRRCDEWAKERFGFETVRGDALNGHDLKPFENATEYARTVLDVLKRGTEAVVTPEYVEAIKAKAMGDDALDAYLGVEHRRQLPSGRVQSVTGAPVMEVADRSPDEIAQERNEKFGRIMSQNFIAVYNAFNEKFAFTPTEDRIIASAVRSRDGLKEREMQDEFARLAYDDPERAANILELIRRTKKDEYGFMRDAFFEISESWGGTFTGLVREAGEFGSKAGLELGFKGVLNESGGQYYWNDAEKALFARLSEDFNAKPKRGMYGGWEYTLGRDRQMPPLEFVNWQCAGRLAREAMPLEERNNRRKAELMLEEASRHAPLDHGLFYKAVVGGVSTVPYMFESAVGPIGFAAIALNQFGSVRDQIIMEGGDPDEAVGMQLVLATGWAAVERLEFAHLFGKPLTSLSRRAVLMNIADTSWKNGKLRAIGKAVRTMGPEYAMTLLAENTEEGLQGAIERGTVTAFTTHDWRKTVGDAVAQFGKDFVDSTPTMVGLTGIGAVRKYSHAKRYAYDTDSLADFAAKYVRSVNIFRDTCAAPAQAKAAGEQAVDEWKQKAAKDMWFDACTIWRKHIDDRSGGVAALEEIRGKYNLNDEQARQVGEAMDLRENLGQLAGADENAEAVISGSAIRGAFRIGSDTTYDPVDLMRAVNPDIRIETVTIPGASGEQTDEMKALVARQAAAKAKVGAAKVGSARKGAERELRRIDRKIAHLRHSGREFVGTERKKVTIPLQNGETRSYFIEENREGPDVTAPGFGQSVAEEMRSLAGKRNGQGTLIADGAAISTEQFAAMPSEEKMNVAVTPEQYESMTPEEQFSYCRINEITSGGDFRLLDERNRVVYDSHGVVEMMRAFLNPVARVGGNWTLAHEHGHAVAAFAREIGQLPTDSARVAVLRRLFGDPTGANELWNEERMMNGFADYLRDKIDFRRMTDEERRAAKGVFGKLFDTLRGIFAGKGERMPDTASQKAAREQAMDAAFEALRKGDFAGLDAFAGLDVGDVNQAKAEDAPKPPRTPSAEKAGEDAQAPVRRAPASPTPASAQPKEKAAVPEPDDEAYKAGFAAALAQISENPDAFAANLPVRTGTKRTVFTPGYEMHIEADAMWTPLDTLVESTDDREVQMRDRSRVATDQQVHSKTRKGVFQPLALFPGSKSDDGAPIVGGGLHIISGHVRKRMLQQLAAEGRYGEYLDATNAECERQGMPTAPEGMKNPVLVLRVTGGLEKREDLTRFAELSNRWGGLERSGAEHAESDARKITPALLSLYAPDASGNLLAASNRPFMASFLKEVGSTGLTNADGTPTPEAAIRVQRAMMTAIFGADDKVRAMVQNLLERNQELSLGTLQNALLKSAGKLLAMKTRHGSFDIVPDVREAACQYIAWRSAQAKNPRLSLADHLNQEDLFDEGAPAMQQALAKLLEADRFGRVLDKYSDLVAQQAVDDQDTFAGLAEKRTPLQLLGFAERAVIDVKKETPVTPDPSTSEAAAPVQTPPAASADTPPSATAPSAATPVEEAQTVLAPPEPETFVPVPAVRGTATLPGPGATGIDGYQVNAAGEPATRKRHLPPGAYNLLRAPYDVRRAPRPSAQDKAGRGLGISNPPPTGHDDIFPHFQGNKTEMAHRTSQAIRRLMSKAEREHYETVVDYFGGGGCWGLYHALENFPNAKLLVINEWDAGRTAKIRLLQEIDGEVADRADAIIGTFRDVLREACRVAEDGGESGSGKTIANKLEPFMANYDGDDLGALTAFYDCASTMLGNRKGSTGAASFDAGMDAILANLREDGRKAKAAADEFKARGGRIVYRNGDAANFQDAPKGNRVVAVCDPPYYLTSGYNGQVTVPLDAHGTGWDYKTTRDLLGRLVDDGDALVYTDEAWWHKEDYANAASDADMGGLFGSGILDEIAKSETFRKENAILLDIINTLDHFDVAGRVVKRQEVLGIHHGHETNGQTGESKIGTGAELDVQRGEADGRGDSDDRRHSVRRMAGAAAGEGRAAWGTRPHRGREGRRAIAREVIVQDIASSVEKASPESDPAAVDALVRHSVRSVREDRMAAYAKAVGKNAKRWLADMDDTDGALPIPLEMRADQSIPDVRYSVAMGNRAKEEARAMIAKYRPDVLSRSRFVNGEEVPDVDFVVDQIAAFDTPKERKAALFWFCKDTIRLPEDSTKVIDAIKTAEKAKVDPFQFERPGELLEKYAEYRPTEPPTDPDTVPELSDRRDMGHGIVTYLVQDDRAGQAAMRRIVNTHFGRDASPWCLLQGDGNGGLSDSAWGYWQYYSALPKRVAFKDGKLCAFMATDGRMQPTSGEDGKQRARESWWDRADEPHDGIPFTRSVPAPSGEGANATEHAELMPNGEVRVFKTTRGNPKARIGRYEEWFPDGTYKLWVDGKGRDYHFELWVDGIEMEHNETFYDQRLGITRSPDGSIRDAFVNSEDYEHPFMMLYGTFHNKLVIRQADGEAFISEGTPIGADDFVEIAKGVYSALKRNDTDAVDSFVADLKRRSNSVEGPRFSVRVKEPPKRTGIGYKVFFQKNGKLYPPMVANPNGADTPVGVWLDADAAPVASESKTGRPQVRQGGKGTQGGSGMLAYRPGWHLGKIPYALQFNRRDENGKKTLFPADFVWAEVEYAADVDYQKEAEAEGMTANGKFRHSYAGLKRLPTDGFYTYRTNPNPETDPWIITGAMKVNRILTKDEVDEMVRNAGREPQRVATRFSVARVNPNLREEVEAALNTDRSKGEVFKGGRRIVICDTPGIFSAIGIPDGIVYTKAYTLRKIAKEHSLTAEQIASAPELLERPAAVFDDNGEGFVFLTDTVAPDEDGKPAPVMFYIRPDGIGNYVASAYARKEAAESKYVNLANAHKVLYIDKKKVAHLPLRGEAQSSLITFSVGDGVVTPHEGETARIVPHPGPSAQGDAANALRDHGVARAETEAERSSMRHSVFVGAKGARRIDQQQTLEDAVGMLADKFSGSYTDEARDLIYRKTGWWKGVDGLWRYEIRDFRTKKCGETVKYQDSDEYAMENGLRRYTDIDAQWCRLTDMVTHTTLFRAYPMLKDIVVDIVDPDETDFDGTYDPAGNRITLTWDAVEWFDDAPSNVLTSKGLGTLTHEIQHAVQYIEDFAKGGTPEENGKRNYERLAGEVEARNASRRRGGIFWDLTHGKSKGNDLRRLAASGSMEPWNTEDVPSRKQIIADEYGSMTDVNGKRVTRHSVHRGKGMNRADYATALFAARRLAGKEVTPEDADKVLKNLGVTDLTAADALARADQLAERNRGALVGNVERGEPEMVGVLAAAGMRDRLTSAIDQAITGGAAAADPNIGAKVARLIQAKETRDLMAANGFTAADMMAKLPISLADAVFAVAEYEKSPEELARLEKRKKEQDAKRAAELEDEDALSESIDDPTYTEPTAEQKRYYEELMDRARFKEEARKAEEERKRLEKKRKAEEPASADSEDDVEGGTGDADAIKPLPTDTVRRIAPIFEDADQFAAFLVEWVADETCKKHPNIPNTAEMWKNPVAIRELKQTATHILRQLAKDVLGSPSLNHSRNFADHTINELESDAEVKTFSAVRRKIARIYGQIHNNALAISRRQMVNRLIREIRNAAIERGRMSTTKEDLDRKIDAKTEQWCRWVVPVLKMSEEKLQAEIDRLKQMVETDPGAEDAKSVSDDRLREAADRLAILHKYGGMIRWMPGRIADAEREIMDMVNGKRAEFERRRAERDEKNALVKTALIAAMEAGKPAAFRGKEPKLFKWLDSMQGDIAIEMQNLLRYCPDPELRRKANVAIDELRVIISEGGSLYRTTLCQAQRELAEGLEACYGSAEAGIRHLTYEKLPADAAQRLFRNKAGEKPTFGQLLQLYATVIQADYRENAEAHGRTADIPLMEATLTDADRRFHVWAVEWFKANRQSLSDVVEEVTGLPVTSPDGLYTPAEIEDVPEGIPNHVIAWSPVPKQLTRRVKHGKDFRESANFFAVLSKQCVVRARTIGYARAGIALRDTVASRDVREAAKKYVGADDMARVVNHLRDILVQDSADGADRFMDPVNIARKWTARFGISWNVSSMLAQPASIPVWANVMLGGRHIGLAAVGRYLADVDMTAVKELAEDMGFKARYEMGWSEDVQNILRNPSKNRVIRYIEKFYDKGMALPQAVDRLCSLWVAQGFYRDAAAHFLALGDALDEAKRKARALTIAAVESTQQSSRVENLNALQRKAGFAGSLARGFFQFKTAQLLSNNFIIQAAREVYANPKDRKAWGKLARSLFISTVIVPSYMAAKSALWGLLMGDEPEPEDDENLPLWFRELLYGAFDGVAAPIFFVAQVAETPLKSLFGLPTYGRTTGMPAIESTIRLLGTGYRLLEDAFFIEDELRWDAVKSDLDSLVRQSFAPYRHVRKAIENRTDD